uniref:NADH dehydrogenase subunit 1 n=1 Tax=Menacanthus cornutus TaxID=1491751 RepID=UPI002001A9C7|nr:NADH dehydrogenase subunit 1 [Menacanthus cornutus]UNZ12991.1 NADH dehydrogenase subunit 1 [Menacanthus cornutus]
MKKNTMEIVNFLLMYTQMLIMILMIMLAVAFFSLFERKILSYVHYRKGPNKVIVNGILQPFADAIKLVCKDDSPIPWSNSLLYYMSPLVMFTISLTCWWTFPLYSVIFSNKYSIITIVLLMGMGVYGILISGWSSNSKYAMIGSMRSIAQSISYEVIMSFSFLSFMLILSDYSFYSFYNFKFLSFLLLCPMFFLIFFTSSLAELGRSPFDLAEGESELVSGYSIEYGGVNYTLIFLSENVMIFVSSFILTYMFLGQFNQPLSFLSFTFILFLVCVIRGIVPRIRYDQMMMLCWQKLLPMILVVFNIMLLMKYI